MLIIHGVVRKLHRLPNSVNGNPTWRLDLDTPAGPIRRRTAPDTTCAYEITEGLIGKPVTVTLHYGGIIDIRETLQYGDTQEDPR